MPKRKAQKAVEPVAPALEVPDWVFAYYKDEGVEEFFAAGNELFSNIASVSPESDIEPERDEDGFYEGGKSFWVDILRDGAVEEYLRGVQMIDGFLNASLDAPGSTSYARLMVLDSRLAEFLAGCYKNGGGVIWHETITFDEWSEACAMVAEECRADDPDGRHGLWFDKSDLLYCWDCGDQAHQMRVKRAQALNLTTRDVLRAEGLQVLAQQTGVPVGALAPSTERDYPHLVSLESLALMLNTPVGEVVQQFFKSSNGGEWVKDETRGFLVSIDICDRIASRLRAQQKAAQTLATA